MKLLTTTIARILFCVPFLVFGLFHLMNANQMAGMIPPWLPGGIVWVYISGLGMLAAAVAILTKRQDQLACLLLAGMLFIFILTLHLPGLSNPDPMMAQMAMSGLLKDTGLMGGALTYAGLATSGK